MRFEKENIDTATMSGEMMTALFASFAQAESESISGNMRWSYQKRMQSGTFLPSSVPYGYRICNRQIVIDEEEAKIVRRIFKDYLAGINMAEIAASLNRMGIPKRKDNAERCVSSCNGTKPWRKRNVLCRGNAPSNYYKRRI